jgi:hypothetical protein
MTDLDAVGLLDLRRDIAETGAGIETPGAVLAVLSPVGRARSPIPLWGAAGRSLGADRSGVPARSRSKPPLTPIRPPLRDRKFADSLLEESGFEPLVPLTLNPTNAGERDEKKRSSSW